MTHSLRVLLILMTLIAAWRLEAQDDDAPKPVEGNPQRPSIYSRSLPRLLDLAEQNSPAIKMARYHLAVAEREKDNAFWRFFPTLDLEGKHGYSDGDPRSRETTALSELNLVMKQSLYDPDKSATWSRYRLHLARYERAQLEYRYQRDEQLLRVSQAYLDWSASLQQREIDENKRDLLRRQFNVLDAQYKQGLKTKRDVLRIETEIKRLEMDILGRDHEVDLNFQKLASHVGMTQKDLESYKIEGEEAKPYGIIGSDAEELKASNHLRAKIFERLEEEKSQETAFARLDYWPKLTFESEVKYHNRDYIDATARWEENQVWSWSALLVLRYNLWDFGVRRRDLQIATIKQSYLVEDNRQKLFDLTNELREVYLRLREFREHVKTTRELLVLEQQSYSILEAEYRNGRTSYLDLITNLNSLIDARSKFMSSYFGFKKQQVVYSFHKGDLYEHLKQK